MAYRIFSYKEHEILEELTEAFRNKVTPVADAINLLCRDQDCSAHIQNGYRTTKRQLKLYKIGRKLRNGKWIRTGEVPVITHAKPGQSPHEYRLAVHVTLLKDSNEHWLEDDDPRWHSIVGKTVNEHGLTWGGDFKNIFDAAHIEDPDWREVASELDWRGLQ